MIQIVTPDGRVSHRSRNLRGILDHARRVGLILAAAYPVEQECADLYVIFGDGATCHADFASYQVLCQWLHARRSWRGVRSINGGELF